MMLISLYTSRVILNALGVEDYGIYNVVGGIVAMFSLLSGSMTTAISRFITFELGKGDIAHLKNVFSSSIYVQLIFSLVIVLLGETVGLWFLNTKMVIPPDRIVAANWCFQFSLITFVVNLISVPYNAVIIAHEKMSAFAYISILEVVGKLGIAFLIVVSIYDRLVFFAFLTALLALIIRLIYGWYCKKHFKEAVFIFKVDVSTISPIFHFAGWNLFGSGSAVLRNQGIDILLNLFFGVAINAAKGICNQVQSAVFQFVSNFQTAINPQLTIAIAQENYTRNHSLVIQGSRFSFYLLTLFSIPFLVETEPILKLWLGEVPDYTVQFVQWTFIYFQVDVMSRFLINSVLAYGKIKNYQIVVGGTKLAVFPIVWIVLLLGGSPVTGLIVNVIIEVFCLWIRLLFNNHYTGLPIKRFIKESVIRCWFVFIVILASVECLKLYIFMNSIIVVVFSIVLTIAGVWILGLSQYERKLIKEKALLIIKRKSQQISS